MTEDIFYDDKSVNYGPFSFSIGYIPEKKVYVAIAQKHPKFCFEGQTKEEVTTKATNALKFYEINGIKEQLDNTTKV